MLALNAAMKAAVNSNIGIVLYAAPKPENARSRITLGARV
jgi:hypothetical protein